MDVAAAPFNRLVDNGWTPSAAMMNQDNYPIKIKRPEGKITLEGSRRNLPPSSNTSEGGLTGRGAKGIDSLAGKPGLHPALMEDLATTRISVAQTIQRIIRTTAHADSGEVHDVPRVKRTLLSEEDIIGQLGDTVSVEAIDYYRRATKVTMHGDRTTRSLTFGAWTRIQEAN